MTRPPWEVADIIRIAGRRFWERYRASLTWPQVKVLLAMARCRTAALGGHLDYCTHCGYRTGISYNECAAAAVQVLQGHTPGHHRRDIPGRDFRMSRAR